MAHEPNWKDIQDQKEKFIKYNNAHKNETCVKHDYHVGDKLLIHSTDSTRKLERPYDGPYEIIRVYSNGIVAIQKCIINERENICRICLYKQKSN